MKKMFASLLGGAVITLSACDHNGNSKKLAQVPAGYTVEEAVFSTDGKRVVAVLTREGKKLVFYDSRVGKPYEDVRSPLMSEKGTDYAYIARTGGKECVVVNEEAGPLFDSIEMQFFDKDGRIVYAGKKGAEWQVVVGKRESRTMPAPQASSVAGSDGRHILFVNRNGDKSYTLQACDTELSGCVSGGNYSSLTGLKGDPQHGRLSFVAGRGGKQHLVSVDISKPGLNVTEGKGYDDILLFDVSPNNAHTSLLAQQGGKPVLVKDGVETAVPSYTIPFEMLVSDGGKTLYTVLDKDRVLLFADGKTFGKPYNSIHDVVFTPNGAAVAYAAETSSGHFMVVNGNEGPVYDKVVAPRISADGSRVIYRARKDGRRFAVTADGKGKTLKEHRHFDAVWDVKIAPDGKSFQYGAREGQELSWQVEPLQ